MEREEWGQGGRRDRLRDLPGTIGNNFNALQFPAPFKEKGIELAVGTRSEFDHPAPLGVEAAKMRGEQGGRGEERTA